MQRCRPTLACKPLILLPSTLFLLFLHPSHRLMFLAVLLYLLLPLRPDSLRFFSGMLEVSEPGVLNYYTLSCLIPVTVFVSMNPILTHLPLSRSLDSLLYDLTALTPSLAFFLAMTRTLTVASSFLSDKSLSFSELSTFFVFIRLTPILATLGSASHQATPLRSLFLMFMLPLFALLRQIAEPTLFFLLFFCPPEIPSFWGLQLLSPPLGLKKYF